MLELDDIADVIAGAVREATGPLIARIDALEQRELLLPEKGDPGETGPQGEAGPAGEVDMDAVKTLIGDVVAALPPAEKGEPGDPGPPGPAGEVDMEVVKGLIVGEVGLVVTSLPPAEKGEPGRDVDMAEVGNRIENAVRAAVEALPAPKDGEPGNDGVGLADALIDREGALVLTMTDGSTKALGLVVGKDGSDGKDGADGETFTLDDFDIVPLDDERSFKFCFTRGETMHSFEFSFPVVLDRGVWREDGAYAKGDGVTWAGSFWIAQRDAPGKPDTADGGWRLSVKRGRDGKDAQK